MSQPNLHEKLESVRVLALKKAHEEYSKACEQGMNDMVQLARQAENPISEAAK